MTDSRSRRSAAPSISSRAGSRRFADLREDTSALIRTRLATEPERPALRRRPALGRRNVILRTRPGGWGLVVPAAGPADDARGPARQVPGPPSAHRLRDRGPGGRSGRCPQVGGRAALVAPGPAPAAPRSVAGRPDRGALRPTSGPLRERCRRRRRDHPQRSRRQARARPRGHGHGARRLFACGTVRGPARRLQLVLLLLRRDSRGRLRRREPRAPRPAQRGRRGDGRPRGFGPAQRRPGSRRPPRRAAAPQREGPERARDRRPPHRAPPGTALRLGRDRAGAGRHQGRQHPTPGDADPRPARRVPLRSRADRAAPPDAGRRTRAARGGGRAADRRPRGPRSRLVRRPGRLDGLRSTTASSASACGRRCCAIAPPICSRGRASWRTRIRPRSSPRPRSSSAPYCRCSPAESLRSPRWPKWHQGALRAAMAAAAAGIALLAIGASPAVGGDLVRSSGRRRRRSVRAGRSVRHL